MVARGLEHRGGHSASKEHIRRLSRRVRHTSHAQMLSGLPAFCRRGTAWRSAHHGGCGGNGGWLSISGLSVERRYVAPWRCVLFATQADRKRRDARCWRRRCNRVGALCSSCALYRACFCRAVNRARSAANGRWLGGAGRKRDACAPTLIFSRSLRHRAGMLPPPLAMFAEQAAATLSSKIAHAFSRIDRWPRDRARGVIKQTSTAAQTWWRGINIIDNPWRAARHKRHASALAWQRTRMARHQAKKGGGT